MATSLALDGLVLHLDKATTPVVKKEDDMYRVKARALQQLHESLQKLYENDSEHSQRFKARFLHAMARLKTHSDYYFKKRLELTCPSMHEHLYVEANKKRTQKEIVLIMTTINLLDYDRYHLKVTTADVASCTKRAIFSPSSSSSSCASMQTEDCWHSNSELCFNEEDEYGLIDELFSLSPEDTTVVDDMMQI